MHERRLRSTRKCSGAPTPRLLPLAFRLPNMSADCSLRIWTTQSVKSMFLSFSIWSTKGYPRISPAIRTRWWVKQCGRSINARPIVSEAGVHEGKTNRWVSSSIHRSGLQLPLPEITTTPVPNPFCAARGITSRPTMSWLKRGCCSIAVIAEKLRSNFGIGFNVAASALNR